MNNKLTMIENELVPVYETSTGEKVVYGSELYEALGSKRQYTDWIKRRLEDCEALENEDFESFSQKNEKPIGGRPTTEYIIKLDIAKEMAMLERNEKGKEVRRYFIQVEKKYQNGKQAVQDLSPQLQFLINMELRQKEQDKEIAQLQEKTKKQTEVMQVVKETLMDIGTEVSFQQWVRRSIEEIANSSELSCHNYRYQKAWGESYKRLTDKAGCNLDTRLRNTKRLAGENGANKTKIKNISKLSIISDDKKLKEIYISVIREMKIAYCVEVA